MDTHESSYRHEKRKRENSDMCSLRKKSWIGLRTIISQSPPTGFFLESKEITYPMLEPRSKSSEHSTKLDWSTQKTVRKPTLHIPSERLQTVEWRRQA